MCWFCKVWGWRWIGIPVVAGSLFCFTKLILHHPRAVIAASRGSTIADLALTTTRQPEPCIPWSRLTHILPCHTLIPIVWALVRAKAPPVRSPAKASAILDESVTAVTASRFSPWIAYHFVICVSAWQQGCKFQVDRKGLKPGLAASRLPEIVR